jgi:hypothetical protein
VQGPAEPTTPADSKFKEELKKEEKSAGAFDEGARAPPPSRTQVTPAQVTPAQGPAEPTTPADSKFKEELKKEEKSAGAFDEGARAPPPARTQVTPAAQVTPAPAPALDLAIPKVAGEGPNKSAPVQQPQQQQQPEIVGSQAPRKGRSSSDSDASNNAKASIMNRVKGEMKVLLGKASGNKEKVEEGEKMKQKQGTQ